MPCPENDSPSGFVKVRKESGTAVCWVHAVRHFKKYARVNPSDGRVMGLLLKHAELYRIEGVVPAKLDSGKITVEEFLSERKRLALPVIDGIYKTIDEKFPKYTDNDELGWHCIPEGIQALPGCIS